ncbi:hypothetical protein HZA41_03275, partial [Candidatus Peregrinibacteria bacterium]|nr:hypothetical protein [Candidatus Peregrinibacteria bacterium]
LTVFSGVGFVNAQDATVLPGTPTTYPDCETYLKADNNMDKSNIDDLKYKLSTSSEEANKVLGCAIKTGRVRMFMIPYFIVYLIDVFVKLAATLCVLFIVIGGFQYAIGGISDEKEKAKKTILNAILGLVVTSMAWIVINVIQVAITSGGV